MSEPRLDPDEFDVLIEALESWVNKEAAGEIIGDVIMSMLPDEKGEGKTTLVGIKEKNRLDKALRKERAILIQAKLIQMRDQLVAEAIVEETKPK